MIDREQVKELVEKDFPLTKEMLFRAASICDEHGDGLVALFLRYHDRIAELEARRLYLPKITAKMCFNFTRSCRSNTAVITNKNTRSSRRNKP